ncbi:hypothetical protein SCOCK_150081 [Actinacidiphila cocklensis]|uniref:Uncharacterized protein n=1 Tax=Actinacidiphila cocklensis TaxID=887465 RepID=A0A9W4DL02_9ACTN|nr:hypothetical protein SCOCK_150081 [Actinacidiphila cocklensis]
MPSAATPRAPRFPSASEPPRELWSRLTSREGPGQERDQVPVSHGHRSVRLLPRFRRHRAALAEGRPRGLQQFLGDRVAGGGARQDEGADHGAQLRHAVVVASGQQRGAVAYPVDVDVPGAGGLLGLAPQIGRETGDGTAVPGVIAVPDREVVPDQRPARGLMPLCVVFRGNRRVRPRLAECVGDGLIDEVLLGVELLVEAAVGEPGRLHQVGDADRGALLPEHSRGGGYDALPVLLRLRLGHAAHGITLLDWMSVAIYRKLCLDY